MVIAKKFIQKINGLTKKSFSNIIIIRPFTWSQLLHIQLITSGDTKCWLSAFINLDHGFLLCLHNMIYLLSKDNYISPLIISFSDDPNACNIFPFSTKLQSKITSSHIGNHTNVNIIDFVSSKVIAKHFFRGELDINYKRELYNLSVLTIIHMNTSFTFQQELQVEVQALADICSNTHLTHQSQAPVVTASDNQTSLAWKELKENQNLNRWRKGIKNAIYGSFLGQN